MSQLCQMSTSYIILTIICCIFLLLGLYLFIYFTYSMYTYRTKTKLKNIYYIQLTLCNILFIFHIIVQVIQTPMAGICNWDAYLFWGHFYSLSYFYAVALLLWIFISRLKDAVYGSIFHLSNFTLYYYYFIIISLFVITPMIPITWLYLHEAELAMGFWWICTGVYFIHSATAMSLFITKFGAIIELKRTQNGVNNRDNNIIDENQRRKMLFLQSVVRKQTLLVTIALTSTMIVGVVNVIWFYVFFDELDPDEYDYVGIWQLIDCIIGLCTINVQFEHGSKFYNKIGFGELEKKMDRWVLCCNNKITLGFGVNSDLNLNSSVKKTSETDQ